MSKWKYNSIIIKSNIAHKVKKIGKLIIKKIIIIIKPKYVNK